MAHFRILALAAIVFLTASCVAADGKTVSAERILEQIAAGQPVEYDGYIIEGALDLDRLTNLPKAEEDPFYRQITPTYPATRSPSHLALKLSIAPSRVG